MSSNPLGARVGQAGNVTPFNRGRECWYSSRAFWRQTARCRWQRTARVTYCASPYRTRPRPVRPLRPEPAPHMVVGGIGFVRSFGRARSRPLSPSREKRLLRITSGACKGLQRSVRIDRVGETIDTNQLRASNRIRLS